MKRTTRSLVELFAGAHLDVLAAYGPKDRHCVGHGRQYDVYQEFDLHWGEGRQKSRVYCELLRGIDGGSGGLDSRSTAMCERRPNRTAASRSRLRVRQTRIAHEDRSEDIP